MLQDFVSANVTQYADGYAGLELTTSAYSRLHDAQLYDVPVGLLVLLSILYGSISLLAIIGNTLVIWIVATTRQMQSVTNLFIANLALADVIIGMFSIPFQFQAAVLQRWILPEFMCAFCPYVQMVSVNVSVFTLTAIAVDRHRAIINPLRARPPKYVCKIAICVIWIVSLVFAVPIAIALRVIQMDESLTIDGETLSYTKPFCDNVYLTWDQMKSYRYCIVVFQYVLPLCVISFVYIQMAVRLWGTQTPGNAQDSRDVTLMRNKKRVIKMLIIVVLLFGVAWFPLQLYHFLQVTYVSINEYRYINIIWFCSDWLAMSNSCYNPFIYGIYNEKFKREFQRRFPIFRPARADGHGPSTEASDQTVSMYTRASSVRSTSHLHNNNHAGATGAGRHQKAPTIKLEPINWQRSNPTVTIEPADDSPNGVDAGAQPSLVRNFPKVAFQPIAPAIDGDGDGDDGDDDVSRVNGGDQQWCAKCSQTAANGNVDHTAPLMQSSRRCVCFDKSKRYSDEYVQL